MLGSLPQKLNTNNKISENDGINDWDPNENTEKGYLKPELFNRNRPGILRLNRKKPLRFNRRKCSLVYILYK